MKKTLVSMFIIASCFSTVNAQLIVDENGHIGMNIDTNETLTSNVSVNSLGQASTSVFVGHNANTHSTGLGVYRKNRYSGSDNYLMSISGMGEIQGGIHNVGVYGSAWTNTSVGSGRTFGVMGIAGGATSGWNYGVCGMLTGTGYGAGVYGSTTWDNGVYTGGLYAGYFNGPVKVTGALTAQTVLTLSDYRVKENVQTLSNSSLDNIMDMNVVEYNYNVDLIMPLDADSDTTTTSTRSRQLNEAVNLAAAEKHYGLIAQELQEIYPNLVIEGEDGYLGVNYIEIIPLLIRSIQELNAKIEQYEQGEAPIQKAQGRTADATGIDAVVTTLYQNEPNPFTESTVIRVDVAEGVTTANLYIYNMNGEQITKYPIVERGATSVTIDGGSLSAGMYLYALIADGQVIDTKRMILTK